MEETNFTRVGEFHSAFNHPKHDTPQMDVLEKESKLVALRYALINEELKELGDAIKQKDMVEVADALGDMLYILCGTIIEHGMQHKIDEIFSEIQNSNMSKLGADGNPIYREDGKVLKGPNYFKPNIKGILES